MDIDCLEFIPQCPIPTVDDAMLSDGSLGEQLIIKSCVMIPKAVYDKHGDTLNKKINGKNYMGMISVDGDVFVINRNCIAESTFVQEMFAEPADDSPLEPHYIYDPSKDQEIAEMLGNAQENNLSYCCTTQVMEHLLKMILLNFKFPLPTVEKMEDVRKKDFRYVDMSGPKVRSKTTDHKEYAQNDYVQKILHKSVLDFISEDWQNAVLFFFKREVLQFKLPELDVLKSMVTPEDHEKRILFNKIKELTKLLKCKTLQTFNELVYFSFSRYRMKHYNDILLGRKKEEQKSVPMVCEA